MISDNVQAAFQHTLANYFSYDPETGKIYYKQWYFGDNLKPRHKQWNTMFIGKEAVGWKNGDYIRINFKNKQIYAHQIAFAIMTGYIPEEVDHKDLNKSNNKWSNLREASHNQNMANTFKRANNKSGVKGVSWSKWTKSWRMDFQYHGIKYYSFHLTKEEAYKAYCEKSAELHKEFGRVD